MTQEKADKILIIIGILILCAAFYFIPINMGIRENIAANKASNNEKIIYLQKEILKNAEKIKANLERDIRAMEKAIQYYQEEMEGE